ncbi:MAG: HAMP domain-containing protein [bacterium]|nr:HAMP domain-containing protein [bacterium]
MFSRRFALHNQSLQTHIMLGLAVAAVAAATVISLGTVRAERRRLAADLAADTHSFASLMAASVESATNGMEMSLRMLLADPEIAGRFAAGDRQWLAERLVPLYESKLKPEFGLTQLGLQDPATRSFFRVHQPKKFGDDLSGIRADVVRANAARSPVRGLEVGSFGPGLRVVLPVTHQGAHVGTIDAGASMQRIFADLGEEFGFEFALGIDRRVFENAKRKADPENDIVQGDLVFYEIKGDRARVAAGLELPKAGAFERERIEGRRVMRTVVPLADWSGKEIGVILLVKDVEEALAAADAGALRSAGLIAAMLAAVMAGIAFMLRRRVLRPLLAMTEITGRLAAGDLHQRVSVKGGDEIARLGEALNGMADSLRDIIRQVNQGSEQIAGAAGELDARSEDTVTGTRQALDLAQVVAASGESLRAGSQDIAASIQAITDRLNQVAAGITQMDATIHEIARSSSGASAVSRAAHEQVQAAAAVTRELAASSERITQIVDVITRIAGRTNLLALNATIEAASAGEAGRSFAVVANEVKELSLQTTTATNEVRQLIQAVQEQIGSIVGRFAGIESSMSEVLNASHSIAAAVEEQSATSNEISSASNAVRDDAQAIAARAEAGAHEADEIARSIAAVSRTLDEATSQVQRTRENSVELTGLSQRLQEAIVVFQV